MLGNNPWVSRAVKPRKAAPRRKQIRMKMTIDNVYPWVRQEDVMANGALRKDLCMVDVRTPSEFGEMHIPGALNIPLADLRMKVDVVKIQAQGNPVVLMCRTQNRATMAYEQLEKAGVPNCHVLEGGMAAWDEAKHPVVRGQKGMSLERQVRMLAGAVIVLGVLLGFVIHPWLHVFPAVVGAGLFHAGMTDSCMMAMLLSKLPFNRSPWTS